MDGFIQQFDSEQLTKLQKSELNLINKLIQSIHQSDSSDIDELEGINHS